MTGHQPLPDLELVPVPDKNSEDHDSKDARSLEEGSSQTELTHKPTAKDTADEIGSGGNELRSQHDTPAVTAQQQSRYEELVLPRDPEWIRRASIEHHQRCHLNVGVPEDEQVPMRDDESFTRFCEKFPLPNHGSACDSISHYSLLAMMNGTPLRPFPDSPQIVTLASVTGVHKSRNRNVDVLAVIEHVDESITKPPKMSMKRNIRIQDPSVDEPVVVSVFVDPVNFRASVGVVALFRHVTTHDWKRGNLNAYPARVSGREWFIPNPQCLGLRDQVCHVEDWWRLQMQGIE